LPVDPAFSAGVKRDKQNFFKKIPEAVDFLETKPSIRVKRKTLFNSNKKGTRT